MEGDMRRVYPSGKEKNSDTRVLNAGYIHMTLNQGEIKDIFVKDQKIIVGIYFAVRDCNWDTAVSYTHLDVYKRQGKDCVMVEVNSETDFVSKNADFQAYVAKVADQALKTEADSMEAFMAEPWIDDASVTVEQALSQKTAIIGEMCISDSS